MMKEGKGEGEEKYKCGWEGVMVVTAFLVSLAYLDGAAPSVGLNGGELGGFAEEAAALETK
jgi:hypothetical protein